MPDISMCRNSNCELRSGCFRYLAHTNDLWQAYADFKPVGERCAYFTPLEGWGNVRKVEDVDARNATRSKDSPISER